MAVVLVIIKGQLMAQLLGTKAYLEIHKQLPFHVKFVFEGEEGAKAVQTLEALSNSIRMIY